MKHQVAKMIVFAIAMAALVTLGVMTLWNWLVPSIFAGPMINFWQSAGLLLLCRLLFGRPGWVRHLDNKMMWKNRMSSMTPEEREKMKNLWRARCSRSMQKSEE